MKFIKKLGICGLEEQNPSEDMVLPITYLFPSHFSWSHQKKENRHDET
jgi:hypothetical protein